MNNWSEMYIEEGQDLSSVNSIYSSDAPPTIASPRSPAVTQRNESPSTSRYDGANVPVNNVMDISPKMLGLNQVAASGKARSSIKTAKVTKRPAPPQIPLDSIVLARSCSRCRIRKVKCDRIWPRCSNCFEREEECDLKTIQSKSLLLPSSDLEDTRIFQLEARLASLEAQSIGGEHIPSDLVLDRRRPSLSVSVSTLPIGHSSLDWALANSTMARSLTQHLTEAFYDSCCSHLPAFAFFRERIPDYNGDTTLLPASAQSAVAAFCAVGARASPHSALLGIASDPDDARDHPLAPLYMAGSRRESACRLLLNQAHSIAHEQSLMDETSVENLAALLAMMQMTIFVELDPKKSRTFVRGALGAFKELQDAATTSEEREGIKRTFAFALYTGDAITSAYSRKACLITQHDLISHFDRCGLVIPHDGENLVAVLATLLGPNHAHSADVGLKTATHLLSCWNSGIQRSFAAFSAPPAVSVSKYPELIQKLWGLVDQAREGISFVQQAVYSSEPALPAQPDSHSHHSHSNSTPHFNHATDYLTQVTRFDRDLLDINTMIHVKLTGLEKEHQDTIVIQELIKESTSRVRKGLKVLAFYAKVYICGHDRHLIYHHCFQLELNPNWSRMVLERLGDPGGPLSITEEVSSTEIGWLIEGLQHACFYTPDAERRLAELAPRFVEIESRARTTSFPSPHLTHSSTQATPGSLQNYPLLDEGYSAYSNASPASTSNNVFPSRSPWTSPINSL